MLLREYIDNVINDSDAEFVTKGSIMNEIKVLSDNLINQFLTPAASVHIVRVDNKDNVTDNFREEQPAAKKNGKKEEVFKGNDKRN